MGRREHRHPQQVPDTANTSQPSRHAAAGRALPPAAGVAWLAGLALLLAGCAATVEPGQPFPTPLVERLPLRAAVHYPPELLGYAYQEQDSGQRKWTVQLGPISERMLDTVFGALFASTTRIDELAGAQQLVPAPDLVIRPTVAAFELSTPALSGTPHFAVWVRYQLELRDAAGAPLLSWPVTGYGQAGTGGMSDTASVERATLLALRDAAATIAVELPRQPQVRALLDREPAANEP